MVTNSLPTLTEISLKDDATLYPKNLSTKYLKRYAWRKTFERLNKTAIINGAIPTLKISVTDMGEKINNKIIGKKLTITAMSLQFNLSDY